MLVIHSQSRARLVSIVTLLLLFGCTKPASQDAVAEAEEKSPAKPKHTNRLADETSPYLLLHAHNPVDWYPWGEEALTKAGRPASDPDSVSELSSPACCQLGAPDRSYQGCSGAC